MKFKDQVVNCRKLYLGIKECEKKFNIEYLRLLLIKRYINKDFSPTFKASDYALLMERTILEFKEDLQKYGIIARLCANLSNTSIQLLNQVLRNEQCKIFDIEKK